MQFVPPVPDTHSSRSRALRCWSHPLLLPPPPPPPPLPLPPKRYAPFWFDSDFCLPLTQRGRQFSAGENYAPFHYMSTIMFQFARYLLQCLEALESIEQAINQSTNQPTNQLSLVCFPYAAMTPGLRRPRVCFSWHTASKTASARRSLVALRMRPRTHRLSICSRRSRGR
jgi:hypothetical protein